MRFGIVVFPGTSGEVDCYHTVRDVIGQQAEYLWYTDTSTTGFDCLILPGGYAFGNYLRPGALARLSPVMQAVEEFAAAGGLVLGIGNGFQILCEAGLLPGTFLQNRSLRFESRNVHVRVEEVDTPFTRLYRQGDVLELPIAHADGNYYADDETLSRLRANRQIILRYSDPAGRLTDAANPNGSLDHVAAVCNEGRNVLGMMPHPERNAEELLGSADGRLLFASIVESVKASGKVQEG